MLIALATLVVILSNTFIVARLACFRRGNGQHRPWVSGVAYILIVCFGAQVIELAFNLTQATMAQAGISLVVATLVWRARGNVASIVRMAEE